MARNIKLLVFPVRDVEKAKAFYGKFLDTEPYVTSAYYVGYKVGEMEVGLDPNSSLGPIAYTDVKDIRSSLRAMTEVGAEIVQDVKDVGGGMLIAKVKDADGNVVGLRQQSK
ncbi:MAG TPA: glyoxalase [Candidatus Bathyarchaeia archaeon]|nr:glyoxalase [Candidatus Bathyarchaeia archaeon]